MSSCQKLTLILIFSLFLFSLASPSLAQLEILQEAGKAAFKEGAKKMEETTFIGSTAGKIINAFLGLLGLILLILILYGGFLWMTAGGNTDKIEKAKKILFNAIIGLIIVIAAYGISYFVVDQILKATTGTT